MGFYDQMVKKYPSLKTGPEVTIIAPAIRTAWWLELYEAFQNTNDTKLEFIFIGHIDPDYTLPDNFKHVHCTKSPAYCAALGFAMVETEYVMNIADDYDPRPEHMSKNIVDKCLEEHRRVEKLGVEHFFVGPSFKMGPEKEWSKAIPLLYTNEDHCSPVLTISPLTKISTQRLIGGPDQIFYGMYWDTDVNMRLYEINGQSKVMGLEFDHENKTWAENPNSEEYIFVTERNHPQCVEMSKSLGMSVLSRSKKGGNDSKNFRNLWNPITKKGITLEDNRHYFEPGEFNPRKRPPSFFNLEEIPSKK